jgi:hypothetical protein
MTATPHNGKEEDFQLFMALLDGDRFEGKFRDGVHKASPKKCLALSTAPPTPPTPEGQNLTSLGCQPQGGHPTTIPSPGRGDRIDESSSGPEGLSILALLSLDC